MTSDWRLSESDLGHTMFQHSIDYVVEVMFEFFVNSCVEASKALHLLSMRPVKLS